mmetsp:Transcript_21815/g.60726  ORF Transcript_21815/g.60726 Transcript_21815/m.60726 type:complete len:114 (-) Transcript_21815:2123-2464(-)
MDADTFIHSSVCSAAAPMHDYNSQHSTRILLLHRILHRLSELTSHGSQGVPMNTNSHNGALAFRSVPFPIPLSCVLICVGTRGPMLSIAEVFHLGFGNRRLISELRAEVARKE